MAARSKACPSCGALLPGEASFCPHCTRNIRSRRAVRTPSRRWRKRLRMALVLAVAALLAAALYDRFTPDVYSAWGALTYSINGNDYHLAVTFRNDAVPEAEYTVQVEEDGRYDRASKLFITHVDTGVDAGQMFNQQIEHVQVQVLQPGDSPSPVIWRQPEYQSRPAEDGLLLSMIQFTGQSLGPAEVAWTICMRNGDTIILRQRLVFVPVDTVDYYPEDHDMDTIEDLRALVEQIGAEVPPPTVVNLHLPPVRYEGGLTVRERAVNLYGAVDAQNRRTTFLEPVVLAPEEGGQTLVENIDFQGNGAGTGLTVETGCHVEDCGFSGWDTGLLIGGESWTALSGCLFEGNGVGLRFDSAGTYVNETDFEGNTFRTNGTAIELLRVPGAKTIYFWGCRFAGNAADISNPAGHPIDISYATFE